MKRSLLLLALALSPFTMDAKASNTEQVQSDPRDAITVIAVEFNDVIRTWNAETIMRSIWAGIKTDGWLKNMSLPQVTKLWNTIWNQVKGGNGFGPEELYVAIAQEFNNPALADLVIEIVNSQALNQDVLRRLITLKHMGYKLVVCSKLGKTSYERLRDDEDTYPQYQFINTYFGGKATLNTTTDAESSPATFQIFLQRNNLKPQQVLAIVGSKNAVTAAQEAGIKAVQFKDSAQLDQELGIALNRENQIGVTRT